MARKRFITSEISTDRKIAKLAEKNPTAAALWPWFITAFDDWGSVKRFLQANDLSKVREIWLLHLSNGNSDEKRFKREIQELTGKMVFIA